MSLKSIRKHNFTNLKLECLNKLLFLILCLFLSIGHDASFDDDVVIVVILPLFLQLAAFDHL